MLRKFLTPLLAASALALTASPAYAGKEDRARAAIAAAEAKIHTAESLGIGTELPRQAAEARGALAIAREHFSSDRNREAIAVAIRAQSIADAAIGQLQQARQQALTDERATAEIASEQAAAAQLEAADANARADAAQHSAASAAAEAQAARNALAAQQAAAAEVETTVTTQQPVRATSSRRTRTTVKRTTARRSIAPSGNVTTTTTVRQRTP
jgi:hypothetical protein